VTVIASSRAAFRRLEAKTQVFTRRYSDTSGIVSLTPWKWRKIARTIAAQLGLNVDLVEGSPWFRRRTSPFGHAGERALDAAMCEHGLSFDHNLHALRIVEDFEMRYAAFRAELTFEVREGIIKHSTITRRKTILLASIYSTSARRWKRN